MAKLDELLAQQEKLKQQIYVERKKEQETKRKMLTKQKILLGGYLINKFEKMDREEKLSILNEIKNATSDKRVSDMKAIDDLFTKL